MLFDFHCHSTASDGALSPEKLMARAARNGARHIALTDHDQLAGLASARQTAEQFGMQFIDGVEVSVSWRGMSVHIVGLNLDIHNTALQQGLAKNASGLSFFIYSAFIQRSLLMSNTAGDFEMPEISKISASSESV